MPTPCQLQVYFLGEAAHSIAAREWSGHGTIVETNVLRRRSQVMSFPGSDAESPIKGAQEEDSKEMAASGSVFAVLQAYATYVFAPAVRAYAAARGGDEKASSIP